MVKDILMNKVRDAITDLSFLFENSFINENNELILVPITNLYFSLRNVKTIEDLYFKIIAWCSRDACKSTPFDTERQCDNYQAMVRGNINSFLGTNFNRDQWLDIYCVFGNGLHEEQCRKFIRSGFDLALLEGK